MTLYKYYSPTTNSLKSIVNAGLWCDSYTNMNDPFECLAAIPRVYSEKQLENFRITALKSTNDSLRLLAGLADGLLIEFMNSFRFDFIKSSYFFASLIETYDNVLLWSHYAASHTGFVLAIEADENDTHIQKVTYQDTLPDFDMDWYFSIENNDETDSPQIGYLLKDFAIKSNHWEYEKEWRVARKDRGYFRFKPNQIKALYFGLHCNSDIEKVILMLLDYTDDDLPIYKMTTSNSPVKLTAIDYELNGD